jgi:hypothetical protein
MIRERQNIDDIAGNSLFLIDHIGSIIDPDLFYKRLSGYLHQPWYDSCIIARAAVSCEMIAVWV